MEDLMLYPIWQQLPRPRFFPQDPRLDRLLASNYDRGLDGFQLALRRREARDLRKGLFGPKGSRVVPKSSGSREKYDGMMEFDLPNGWRLRLTYEPPPSRRRAGTRSLSRLDCAGAVAIPRREFLWRLSHSDAPAGSDRPARVPCYLVTARWEPAPQPTLQEHSFDRLII